MAQKVQPAAHRRPTRRLGRPSPDLRGHDKRNSRGSAAATSKVSALAPPAPSRLFADAPLMERFGFLIRRLHQIHVALFMQEAKSLDITTIQFTALSVLHQRGEIDQSELAVHVGIDRANVSDVMRRLLNKGYVDVRINPAHGRKRLVQLTAEGASFLKLADQCALRAQERTVSSLTQKDQNVFAALLRHPPRPK
jgi:MarR family transcriptional regulator, lower aerobic nicotinate degradation pathway regulator